MKVCQYVYCREILKNDDTFCPACGYPIDSSEGPAAIHKIKGKLPKQLIDMHQIIPNRDGIMDVQLEMMAEFNIEKALLQSVPSKMISIWGNKKLSKLQYDYPDQFIASHYLDPRQPSACSRLRQYKEKGIKAIKLLPCLGYYPDQPGLHHFWETMESLRLIAMIHTGFITARHKEEECKAGLFLHSKYGEPIFFDILARKYPNLQLILCHTGGEIWYEQAVAMINSHENVWGDISGFGIIALKQIIQNKISVDWHKLFWGNDSSPLAYPYNLHLIVHHLKVGQLTKIAPFIFYHNAKKFIDDFFDDHTKM